MPPARRRKLELGGSCTRVVEAISSPTDSSWQHPLSKAHRQRSMINLRLFDGITLFPSKPCVTSERWTQAVLHKEELKSGSLFDESKANLPNLELDRV